MPGSDKWESGKDGPRDARLRESPSADAGEAMDDACAAVPKTFNPLLKSGISLGVQIFVPYTVPSRRSRLRENRVPETSTDQQADTAPNQRRAKSCISR